MSYLLLRQLHIIGAIVLLGTGAGIAFFTWYGYQLAVARNSIELLRGTLILTVRADWLFTTTAAVIQPITGALLWHMTINNWQHWWLWTVIALYIGVGLCWLPVVAIQIRLRNLALAAPLINALDATFHRLFRRWFALGVPSFLMMLVLLSFMVMRAPLYSL